MDKLLIVEDELQIRRGLRAIAGRAGIPIGEILECKNGLEALEILKEQQVDVMFTDIRMPHMDGLELIRQVGELPPEHQPEIVVVSGYDDFNYAVEAMRHGAREYLLKPVERERVYEILRKLEQDGPRRKQEAPARRNLDQLGRQQLKYMLLNPDITEEEVQAIRDAFTDLLAGSDYMLFCVNQPLQREQEGVAIQLDGIGVFHVLVYGGPNWREFAGERLSGFYTGGSGCHRDLGAFRTAFEEAVEARKYAFYTGTRLAISAEVEYGSGSLLQQDNPRQLARRVGTREYAGLIHLLNGLFTQSARGLVPPHAFEGFVLTFLEEVGELFGGVLDSAGVPEEFRSIYGFDTVDSYRLALQEWLDGVHCKIMAKGESIRNRERIMQALDYIHENYGKGSLNMAVVSNHISMNYSVFSQLFKEYTGRNFVDYLRDIRIDKARELLAGTDLRISEISAQTGYENDKYFMKAFKAAVGVSPTQYRKTEGLKK